MTLAADESKPLFMKGRSGRTRSKSRLTCGGLVKGNERDSGVMVVHECFPERGESIVSAFSWESLRINLQDN